jgi:ribose transport system permease protein
MGNIDPETDQQTQPALRTRITDLGARYAILAAWAGVAGLFALLRPDRFATLANAQTILGSQAILLILTLGLIVTLRAGEIDLSFAGVLSISLVLVAYLNVETNLPIGLAVLIVLAPAHSWDWSTAFWWSISSCPQSSSLGMGTLLVGAE